MVDAIRAGRFVTADRAHGYGLVLLACELALFAFALAVTHGWFGTLERPASSDFVSFYGAGLLADAGTPALAYDRAAHYAAEQAATQPGIEYNFFFYPPVFLLLCAALARLPYFVAFVALQAGGLAACLTLARRIAGTAPIGTLLAFPSMFWAVGTGQNALLTAALLGGATLAIDRRPVLSGLLMGALCYKPHLGLLLPVALVAGRHWQALAAAGAIAASLVCISWIAFGTAAWRAFLQAGSAAGPVYGSAGGIDLAGMTSAYGFVLALGGSVALAAALQAVVTVAVMGAVAFVWGGRHGLAARAAVLLAAIPAAVPAVMFYDLVLTGFALAWLVRDGLDRGWAPWARIGLAVLFVLPLMSGNTGFASQIGTPPMAAALGFVLAFRQALHETVVRPRGTVDMAAASSQH